MAHYIVCDHLWAPLRVVAGLSDNWSPWTTCGVCLDPQQLKLVAFASYFYHAVRHMKEINISLVLHHARAFNALSNQAIKIQSEQFKEVALQFSFARDLRTIHPSTSTVSVAASATTSPIDCGDCSNSCIDEGTSAAVNSVVDDVVSDLQLDQIFFEAFGYSLGLA